MRGSMTNAESRDDPDELPQGALAREAIALAAFDLVVSHAPGFRARGGQREMAAFIAETLSGVKLGDDSVSGEAGPPDRGIAVVQAGTPLKDLMAQSNHPNQRGHALVAEQLLRWFPAK